MSDITTHLLLPYILASQAQKHVTHNEALAALDLLVQARVTDWNTATAPAAPADGEAWVVATGAGGAWAGRDRQIAMWRDGSWTFHDPGQGTTVWIGAENRPATFDGTAWTYSWANQFKSPDDELAIGRLGVGTAPEAANPVSVKAASVLFSHPESGGNDIRMILNKASPGATSSVLFQSGWSGRAEIGLAGDDNLRLKVSANGSTWTEAMNVNAGTGKVEFPNTPVVPVALNIAQADRLSPAFAMRGYSLDNTGDTAEGVGLYLTHNAAGNRQFALLATDTRTGVRVTAVSGAATLDGYSNGARMDLSLGSSTNGAHVGATIASTQFSVNNAGGTLDKTVCEVAGATGQTGDLLAVGLTTAARGDALRVTAGRETVLGGTARLKACTVATLPSAVPAGGLVYVSNEAGGAVVAFSDGTNWRRLTDRAIVS